MYCCAADLIIMCCLQQAVGRQMSGFEPSLRSFCVFFPAFFCYFGWSMGLSGSWVNMVLFTAAIGLQISGFGSSLFPLLCVFSLCFPFFFFGWVRGFNCCCCSYYSSIFHSIPYPKYTCFWLVKSPNVWCTFLLAASLKPENFKKKSRLPPSNLKYVVLGNT